MMVSMTPPVITLILITLLLAGLITLYFTTRISDHDLKVFLNKTESCTDSATDLKSEIESTTDVETQDAKVSDDWRISLLGKSLHHSNSHHASDLIGASEHWQTHHDHHTQSSKYLADPKHSDVILAEHLKNEFMNKCGNGTLKNFPVFNPELYNDPAIQPYANCYFYSFADVRMAPKSGSAKPQPGIFSGHARLTKEQLTTENLVSRVLSDHPSARWIPVSDMRFSVHHHICNAYKVYLMIDEHRDYHFIRSHPASFSFSHKPGSAPVSIVDANGDYIVDPMKCSFDYSAVGGPNYKIVGSFDVKHTTDQVFGNINHHAHSYLKETFPLTS